MLRPAVAAANCDRAGKASGLDIGRAPVAEKARYGRAATGRPPKVPGRGEAVNDRRRTALSPGTGAGLRARNTPPGYGLFGRAGRNSGQNIAFTLMSKAALTL